MVMPRLNAYGDSSIRVKNLYARKALLRHAISRNYGLMHFAHGPRRRELYTDIQGMKAQIGQINEAIKALKQARTQQG
jgi:hypothetical protein